MGHIFGIGGFTKLALGYPVNINDVNVRTATVDATAEDGIEPGALVIATEKYNSVITTDTVGEVLNYEGKVLGIAMATNVKLDPCFPQSKEGIKWMPGEALGYVTTGEVTVKLTGAAPAPNAAVYYDVANGAFTATAGSNLALTNMRFVGITEGTNTVVRVLY